MSTAGTGNVLTTSRYRMLGGPPNVFREGPLVRQGAANVYARAAAAVSKTTAEQGIAKYTAGVHVVSAARAARRVVGSLGSTRCAATSVPSSIVSLRISCSVCPNQFGKV